MQIFTFRGKIFMQKWLFSCVLAFLAPSILLSAPTKSLNVFLTGTGVVGGALLDQIKSNHDQLLARYGIDIRVVGIANSRATQINENGLDLKRWQLRNNSFAMSSEDYFDLILSSELPNVVFVDCSSSQEIADGYAKLLGSGISVVTPNKKATSGSLASYQAVRDAAAQGNAKFYYDANVGAGLPILSTLDDLMKSGDQVIKIEAVLSGTLSYIFNSFLPDTRFSAIVRKAQQMGYTEPDPRDDLNGMDFARKLLILAREAGYPLEMEEIEVDSILPEDCLNASSIPDFYLKLASHDDYFGRMRIQANSGGYRILYIGTLENGKASIRLQSVSPLHPFYFLSGNDNIVSFTTKYYSNNPLVIEGPGAGPDVTAAKVLQGIVRVGLN